MRGAVTVAAAQTLPTNTPYRPQLLLIAFTVAVATLLVQGLSLPSLIRALHLPGDDPTADQLEYAQLLAEMTDSVRTLLYDPHLTRADGSTYPTDALDRVRHDLRVRSERADEPVTANAGPTEQYRDLMMRALTAERDVLLTARSNGTYSSRALSRAQRSLDVDEARMQLIPTRADN